MRAKACSHNIIPPKLVSPLKLPQINDHTISLPNNNHIPRAISITARPLPEVVDDKVTAYWDYQFLFFSQRSETTEPINLSIVDGAIPLDFPSGTYYLTGPGLFSDDHGSTVHPLDGHGYLRSFKMNDGFSGKIEFMAKYIQTEAQVEERDPVTGQWRFTHRGPFSVLKGGKMVGNTKVMKNVANTSVLRWGGRLFCLWEGGDPYEIQPNTLDTVGRFDVINGSKFPIHQPQFNLNFLDIAARILKPILHGNISINLDSI